MSIYPKTFPSLVCSELDDYTEIHKNQNEKISLMRKLLANQDMKVAAYPVLLKIKDIKVSEGISQQLYAYFSLKVKAQNIRKTILPSLLKRDDLKINALLTMGSTHLLNIDIKLTSIFLFLHYCIQIYEQANEINPMQQKEYAARLKRTKKNVSLLSDDIRALLKNEINYALMIHSEQTEKDVFTALNVLEKITHSIVLFSNTKSYNKQDKTKRSRKANDFKYEYFITRLYLYITDLFKKPMYKVIATATNAAFDTDRFNEENVRMRIDEFNKRRIR